MPRVTAQRISCYSDDTRRLGRENFARERYTEDREICNSRSIRANTQNNQRDGARVTYFSILVLKIAFSRKILSSKPPCIITVTTVSPSCAVTRGMKRPSTRDLRRSRIPALSFARACRIQPKQRERDPSRSIIVAVAQFLKSELNLEETFRAIGSPGAGRPYHSAT